MERVPPRGAQRDSLDPKAHRHLSRFLDDRREAIVREWRRALLHRGLTAMDPAPLQRALDDLAERITLLLLHEPFPEEEAVSVGAALARVSSAHQETLGCSVDILGHFLTGLSPAHRLSLQSRLQQILSRIATGFLREHEELVREQQHDMHRALFDAQQRADVARRSSEARYRAVVREATEGIILVDPRTTRIVETKLRPAGLDEGGLIAALENYAGTLPGDTAIHLAVSPEVEELSRSLAICVVRVVQEAVRNALRHGRAREVSIRLRPRPAGIILRVSDNGAGFIVIVAAPAGHDRDRLASTLH